MGDGGGDLVLAEEGRSDNDSELDTESMPEFLTGLVDMDKSPSRWAPLMSYQKCERAKVRACRARVPGYGCEEDNYLFCRGSLGHYTKLSRVFGEEDLGCQVVESTIPDGDLVKIREDVGRDERSGVRPGWGCDCVQRAGTGVD